MKFNYFPGDKAFICMFSSAFFTQSIEDQKLYTMHAIYDNVNMNNNNNNQNL